MSVVTFLASSHLVTLLSMEFSVIALKFLEKDKCGSHNRSDEYLMSQNKKVPNIKAL